MAGTTLDLEDRIRRTREAGRDLLTRNGEELIRCHALERRDQAARTAADLLAAGPDNPDAADRDGIAAALAESDQWAARASEYAGRQARRAESARVVREPLTYEPRSPHSWVRDNWNAKRDGEARGRLERHGREMEVELRARAGKMERRYRGDITEPQGTTFEKRTPTGTVSTPSSFTPPLWLIDRTATMPRPERTFADLVPSFPLADGVASVNIPRLTAGTITGTSAGATPVAQSEVFTDAATTSKSLLIAGMLDVPLQMLEQSPVGASLDLVVWRDLLSAWDAQLEGEMLAGSGTGAQLLGLLNVQGTNSVTYTAGSPTAIGAYPYLGQAFGAVADTRRIRPECWLMRGGRWAWWVTGEDEEKRPLGVPDAHNPAPVTPDGVPDPVGALIGIPVFTAEAIPKTLGEAGNQDVTVAARPSDCLLWEGEPRTAVFLEPGSGDLGARIMLRAYAAFIAARYPSSICPVGGTGMTVQTNE